MEPEKSNECPLHDGGPSAQSLVGRRLTGAVGSWHLYGGEDPVGPLGVWLVDDQKAAVHITTGSDWCLIVEVSEPHVGHDMGDSGLIAVEAMGDSSPFAAHIGESVVAVREKHEPNTGRMALELSFPTGRVCCESWGGDLRLTAVR
ncbi:hypothetical protein OG814_38910 [Streptomyces zaomyceticus]|uniref:Uncharacterized protein n=1 Tax=Streptomyces zaomyceticus TaxID=68286 RepID=A0ABZ1LNY1_9ACTN